MEVKLREGFTFQVFRLTFFILARYCMNHIPLSSVVIGYPDMGKLAIAQAGYHTTLVPDAVAEQQIAITEVCGVVHDLNIRLGTV